MKPRIGHTKGFDLDCEIEDHHAPQLDVKAVRVQTNRANATLNEGPRVLGVRPISEDFRDNSINRRRLSERVMVLLATFASFAVNTQLRIIEGIATIAVHISLPQTRPSTLSSVVINSVILIRLISTRKMTKQVDSQWKRSVPMLG